MGKLTPMLRQFQKIKENYDDAILFFRLGDFYEMFFEDALEASEILDITLTSRDGGKNQKVPMCGVPYHAAETYIIKLIKAGKKVAICEQIEDHYETPSLLKREVVKVITPGTVVDPQMLDAGSNNYIVSLVYDNDKIGLSYADVSTGRLKTTEFEISQGETFTNEIYRLDPAEFIVCNNFIKLSIWGELKEQFPKVLVNEADSNIGNYKRHEQLILEHFHLHSLKAFGCQHLTAGLKAAGELIKYLKSNQKANLSHFTKIAPYNTGEYMILDPKTKDHLELSCKSQKKTLLKILDKACTAMGARFLKDMIGQPLMNIDKINQRLDAVEEMKNNLFLRKKLSSH
ncbi:MAG: DNA mismatch repair protein MutS, partial [Clostridia bacterium]|nr:DNA mismatch repair protein MutS [Clostridia bacterium]